MRILNHTCLLRPIPMQVCYRHISQRQRVWRSSSLTWNCSSAQRSLRRNRTHEPEAAGSPDLPTPQAEAQTHQVTPKLQPRSLFCFRCCEDGHRVKVCENPINKGSVDQKYKGLKAKARWMGSQTMSASKWTYLSHRQRWESQDERETKTTYGVHWREASLLLDLPKIHYSCHY